jgi:kynureninase
MTIDARAQDASPVTLAAARAEFDADVTYLDTATFGLPPRRSWAALQQALAQWRAGTADARVLELPRFVWHVTNFRDVTEALASGA